MSTLDSTKSRPSHPLSVAGKSSNANRPPSTHSYRGTCRYPTQNHVLRVNYLPHPPPSLLSVCFASICLFCGHFIVVLCFFPFLLTLPKTQVLPKAARVFIIHSFWGTPDGSPFSTIHSANKSHHPHTVRKPMGTENTHTHTK